MISYLDFYGNVILYFLLIVCAILFIRYFTRFITKQLFSKEYGITLDFSDLRIRKNKKAYDTNDFILEFPYWNYSKKDGTADKRRANNHVIWPKCILHIGRYKISYGDPLKLYNIVCKLREKQICIEKCEQEQIKYKKLVSEYTKLSQIHSLEDLIYNFREKPSDFELFCSEIFKKEGYDVVVTPKVHDGGFDLVLYQEDIKSIVECKCYTISNSIGRPLIQKLVGANQTVGANKMIFITTSSYTKDAIKYASETGVELIDGYQILEKAMKYLDFTSNEVDISSNEWWLTKHEILAEYPKDIV